MNLGWKLAATVHGHAPSGLLDSYHDERHPVGERVVENTRAQAVLTNPAEEYDGLRAIFTRLLAMSEVNHYLAGMVSGLDIRYPLPGGDTHELLGARMPDLDVFVEDEPRQVHQLLRDGRGLLLTSAPKPGYADLAGPRVDVVAVKELPDCDTDAVLVRPDGHVCWVAPATGDAIPSLRDAVGTWFTEPDREETKESA
jgi:anhydrotetracycline monooxygenase